MKIRGLAFYLCSAVAVTAMVVPVMAQEQQTFTLDIPAQDLDSALKTFASATGQQVVFRGQTVKRKRSNALKGRYTAEEALSAMLAGSGVTATRSPRGVFVIASSRGMASSQAVADSGSSEIVVTGTHIRGGNSTSPVRTLDRQEIDNSGYTTVGQVIRSLPEAFSGGQNPGVVGMAASASIQNQNISNASTVNLRGLGTDATLVLVNGHRLSADAFFQGSDISGIPLQAIQRIEIVTDGASAIYGSDAVAGVANFILKRDYEGLETTAQLGGATQGGGFQQTYSVLAGHRFSQGYILLNGEYSRQNEIRAGQRDFTGAAPSDETLLPFSERRSAFLSAGWDISEGIKLSFDGMYNERDSRTTFQYTHAAAPSIDTVNTPAYYASLSLDANLGRDWNLRLSGGASGSQNRDLYQSSSYSDILTYKNYTQYAEASLDGTPFSLPGGDVKVAFGAGYRREGFSQTNSISATRHLKYAYAETLIPILGESAERRGLNALELSAAVRAEDYSTFGRTVNPKFGLRYVPMQGLTLRTSWGKSFKSPSFAQMYLPSLVYVFDASATGFSGGGQTLLANGGNPNLKPERARSWTISGEYIPPILETLKISASWFSIDYKDRVVQPVPTLSTALSNPAFAPFVIWSPSAASQAEVIAASTLGLFNYSSSPYDPASVVAIVQGGYANATAQKVTGFDFSVRQSFGLSDGSLDVFANATVLKLKQRTLVTLPEQTLSGTIYNPPKFKARGGATWTNGGLSVTGILNHIAGETDTGIIPNQHIGSWTTVDANLAYSFQSNSGLTKGIKLALSVSNLFDQDPPYSPSAGLVYTGLSYDSTNASIVGRFISFSISKAW